MRKRKIEISLFNVLLCLIVVLIHLMSGAMKPPLTFEAPLYKVFLVCWRLSTFVVQAFIFLSGLKTFMNGKEEKYGRFLLKRLKTVVIPYIAAVLLYYLYFVYVEKYFPFSVGDYLGYLIRGDMAAQFYFVIIIVQFYLLYPLWKLILKHVKPGLGIMVAAVLNIVLGLYSFTILSKLFNGYQYPYLDRTITTYIIYWVGGMYAGLHYDKFINSVVKHRKILGALFIVFAIVDLSAVFMQRMGIITPMNLDMLHALYCMAAILFGLSLMCSIKGCYVSAVAAIDRASYYIYLIHVIFIFITDRFITPFLPTSSTLLIFIARCVIVYCACAVFVCIYTGISTAKLRIRSRMTDVTRSI